jgi:secondary thiamine-phosphate synthase enzyme
MTVLRIRTTKHTSFVNITNQVRELVRSSGVKSGLCLVYIPHTTACLFINEGADPDVIKDIAYSLEKLVPWRDSYAHSEGNSAAHIRSAIIGNSRVIPIENGDLVLGTWEAIFLADFDGPRERKVIVKIIKEE